ncbi:MAG TPA: glycosyltransferase [Planctomycetota bacterium]|nr:glycosyltransferase [Planctomycetota bacterium]
MRILLVSHLFPPSHSAGVEVFASELALALLEAGHEVFVLHTNNRVGRRDLQLLRRTWRGLGVFEIVNNLFHEDFEATWNHPAIDALFEEALAEVRPDVVHFHHLMYLSVGCLPLARAYARAVLFTPHDFYLECAAMGQLVHADGSVCHTVDTRRCGTCLPHYRWNQGPWQRRVGKALGALHSVARIDLGPLAKRLAGSPKATATPTPGDVEPAQAERFERLARERRTGLLEAVVHNVDRFLCPSQFLAQRMQRFGLPAERTFLCPTGVDLDQFQPVERPERLRGAPLQITFLGTMIPIKGPHLLVEAWAQLPAALRSRGELSLCGPLQHAPAYVEALKDAASELYVEVTGRLSREQVAAKLAATDLLVMPSMWFENRPLILHEALALGVPCLVSDQGGMAELIVEGRDGWHFPMGDAAALAKRLGEVLAHPETLEALEPTSPDLCSWAEAAERFVAHYEEVLRAGLRP